ncbi:MAG: alpha/beta hydrolase [Myxococcota bacterium]
MNALSLIPPLLFAVACSPSDNATDSGALRPDDTAVANLEAQTFEDLPYAALSSAQALDLSIPAGSGPFPVVVLIHGGGFFTGDKAAMASSAAFLVSRDIAAASINYRLSGEATFPAAVEDAKAAVRFLRANADLYRLDTNRIGSWGESAGANLAAMLGTSSGDAFVEGAELGNATLSSKVTATVAMFAPVDFLTIDEQSAALGFTTNTDAKNSFESQYMGFPVQSDPEVTALANPTTYIDADDAAFLVQAGDVDPLIPYTQSQNFADALRASLGEDGVTFDLFEGAGHGGPAFESDENRSAIATFFETNL